jgi:hypothetical protein
VGELVYQGGLVWDRTEKIVINKWISKGVALLQKKTPLIY